MLTNIHKLTRSIKSKHTASSLMMYYSSSATRRGFQGHSLAPSDRLSGSLRPTPRTIQPAGRSLQLLRSTVGPRQWTGIGTPILGSSRQFSSAGGGPQKKESESGNDYESGFESLMKERKITKEESERFQQRREEKAEESKAQQQKFDKMHD